MDDHNGTEELPEHVERELAKKLVRRAALTREAADLSNSNLARRYGVTPQYLRKLSRRIVVNSDPVAVYRTLQNALHDCRRDYVLFRGADGIVRVWRMDTALVQRDGFLGVVNGDTTVVDIQAMVES